MNIERIKFYEPKTQGQGYIAREYTLGSRIQWKGGDDIEQSKVIHKIELDPTGAIIFTLSGDDVILFGNFPFELSLAHMPYLETEKKAESSPGESDAPSLTEKV